jgi:hypothetical protein
LGAFSYTIAFHHTKSMQRLVRGATSNIVVTLFEKTTLEDPNYLFVFTHTTDKQEVKFIKGSADELSLFPERFNEYEVSSTLFENKSAGQWLYQVYEQASAVNLITTGLTEVENGRMDLVTDDELERLGYTPTITVNSHNG